jgi:hypothetical protein
MHQGTGLRLKSAAMLFAAMALSGCSVALHGHQASNAGATTTIASSSLSVHASGSHHAAAVAFGRPVPTVPGGHLAVSGGTGAAVLLVGIAVISAIDYFSGGWGRGTAPGAAATRPIAHTCSCYGYRPEGASGVAGD